MKTKETTKETIDKNLQFQLQLLNEQANSAQARLESAQAHVELCKTKFSAIIDALRMKYHMEGKGLVNLDIQTGEVEVTDLNPAEDTAEESEKS